MALQDRTAGGSSSALVAAYLERAVPAGELAARQVWVAQEGQMWQRPGAAPRRFTATQHIAIDHVAFSWQARFPILPFFALKVVDEYVAGAGRLDVGILGRTLQHEQAEEMAVGEAMRYLAELPWVPYAMALNPELQWADLDPRRVSVSTDVAGASTSVTLEFDTSGDIVRASAAARPLQQGETWTPTPWAGEFSGYETLGSMRLPTRAEVAWTLPAGRFVYWRGRVISAVALDTSFEWGS
jgi:hypothetical protein